MIALALTTAIFAVSFDYSGELRTRAAMYNDSSERDGGHIDSRFQLRMDSELHSDLQLGVLFEVGDVVWGNGDGTISGGSVNIKTNELYLDYAIKAIDAKLRFGRQYWADHASLVLDDNFNGIMLSKEDLFGFKTDLGYIKGVEDSLNAKDDYNVFLANLEKNIFGLMAMYGKNQLNRAANFTLMPYLTLELNDLSLDATFFVDYQTERGTEDKIGFGTSLKGGVKIDNANIGFDILYASEEGLTVISPYYMSGLYLWGYGACHDGVGIHWDSDYATGSGLSYLSWVGKAEINISEPLQAFSAIGTVLQDMEYMGVEYNGGVRYQLIPELFRASLFGAVSVPEAGADYNYLLGVNGTVNF